MFILHSDKLTILGKEIFKAQGLSASNAKFLTKTLVEASLTGHDSHGVIYFVRYSERIQEGFIDPQAKPEIIKESPTTALVDGHFAPGQITAKTVIETAVEKAKKNGISGVGAYNCNHIGRVGYYTNWAADQDLVALMFVNVSRPAATVFGGTGKVFGTNPFSASVPTGEAKSFLVDYATSVVAAGKITFARSKGEKIPTSWSRDKEGNMTDDPMAVKQGGWLLPFGEYKGYGLQMINELLGAVMTGSRTGFEPNREPPSTNGVFTIAFNPEVFIGLEAFKRDADKLLRQVKSVPPEPGKRVLYPGEPEWETKERRLKEGIPLPEETWTSIWRLAEKLGIDPIPYGPKPPGSK
jgi:uncharacterized oxidoreductase